MNINRFNTQILFRSATSWEFRIFHDTLTLDRKEWTFACNIRKSIVKFYLFEKMPEDKRCECHWTSYDIHFQDASSSVTYNPNVFLFIIRVIFFSLNYRVVRNTRNPVYEEDFTFYGLTVNELQSMSLHFVVLSFDRYSRDDVIGEVVCPFNTIELHQIENQQVALSREIQPRSLKVESSQVSFDRFSETF